MTPAAAVPRASTLRQVDRLFRDRPVVPLVALLALLVLLYEVARPGVVGPTWASGIVAFAIPLAILAGCQTLTMLTGGIDLSVGAVASMAGFVTATFVAQPGGWELGVVIAGPAAATSTMSRRGWLRRWKFTGTGLA